MTVTDKNQLMQIAQYLQSTAQSIQDHVLAAAMTNVGFVLEEAVIEAEKDNRFDSAHAHSSITRTARL